MVWVLFQRTFQLVRLEALFRDRAASFGLEGGGGRAKEECVDDFFLGGGGCLGTFI